MPPKPKKGGRGRSRRDRDDSSDVEEEFAPAPPPRPFTELEGLPSSVDKPEYNLLNNALSLKDSAVLYSSLMKSRKAYTNGNLFDLYWSKGRGKQDNETNARDRMNKLCDCVLDVGPHSFDVRFFILKDEDIERKREEEKNLKKQKRLANKKAREEKLKARELKLQNKVANVPLGQNPAGGDPSAATTSTASTTTFNAPTSTSGEVSKPEDDQNDANDNDDNDSDSDDSDEENKSTAQTREETPQNEELVPPHAQVTDEITPTAVSNEVDQTKTETEPTGEAHPKKPLPPLQIQRSTSPPTKIATPTPSVGSSSSSLQAKPAPAPAKPITTPSDPMQSPESQMMIANLNAIARVDPSLNALMKVVATGSAKPEQIREFQGYIQRAKAMGPSSSFKQKFPNYGVVGSGSGSAQNSSSSIIRKPPPPVKPKKVKPPKEKQLTTFQELYVNGADLVFEYNENPNVRYNLPKDCIVEKVSNNEFLISFLVVHNQEEINKFLERKRVRLEKLANKEKSKQEKEGVLPLKTSAEEQAKGESIRRSTRSKHDDTEKVKTEVIEPKVPAKEEPKEPIPYFTAVSFKLSNVSERYDPIFLNSFNKYDEVKAKMEKILKEGIRVPKYYIWYTVDAYRDEALAENLRNELYLVENPPKGKYKKRGRPSVNTDEKQEVAKRVKV